MVVSEDTTSPTKMKFTEKFQVFLKGKFVFFKIMSFLLSDGSQTFSFVLPNNYF